LERADREMQGGFDDLLRRYAISWAEATATRALVQMELGQRAEALAGARRAIELLDGRPVAGHRPRFVRPVYADALPPAAQHAPALAALADARDQLLALARRITDPAARRRFLEAVPEHARTLDLARRHLPDAL